MDTSVLFDDVTFITAIIFVVRQLLEYSKYM